MNSRHRRDHGFSLVELLVVIVVLGVLATVTVFAVRGITQESRTNVCASDKKTIEQAEEAYYVNGGAYATEAGLVSGGLLKAESTMHDITLLGGEYTVVPVGDCNGAATTTAAPGPTPTPTPVVSVPTSPLTALFTGGVVQAIGGTPPLWGIQGGSTSSVVALIGLGTGTFNVGYEAAAQEWNIVAQNPPPSNYSVLVLDTSIYGNSVSAAQLTVISNSVPGPNFFVIFDSPLTLSDNPTLNAGAELDPLLQVSGAQVCHAANAAGYNACVNSFGL